MKALRIILNDGFLKMAILRSSEPRRSASDLIHGQQSPDGMFNEAVKLLAEFSKNTPERLSAAERDAYVRDTKILGDILYRSDDYFAVGRTETEKELDEHWRNGSSRRVLFAIMIQRQTPTIFSCGWKQCTL